MRFPQVSDRVKEAPAQALRGVFAGIGQLLLFTDKLRNKTPASQQVPRARIPQPSETAPDAPPLPDAAPPLPDAAPPLPDAAPPLPDAAPLLRDAAPPLPDAAPPLRDAAPPLPDAAPAAGYAAPPEPEPAEPTADMPSRAARVTETRDFDKTGNVRLLTTEEAGAAGPGPATGAAATASEAGTAVPDAAPPGRPAPLPNYDELSIASLRARLRGLDVTQLRQLVEYEKAHAARGDVVAMFERRIAKLEAGA